ncbi:MAG TPA: HEPN domain-containing protein [Gammaproteobacteria bacterium]
MEQCERHLDESGARDTEIEAFLTQYLLIVFCAEVEQIVHGLVREMADSSEDVKLASFTKGAMRNVLRGVKKEQLSGLLGLFREAGKTEWSEALTEQDVSRYSSAIGARNDVAHAHGATMTFREIKEAVECTYRILESFKVVLEH